MAARSPVPSWTVGNVRSKTLAPAGADKGSGGRYLIVPPSYDGQVSDGYIVLGCGTVRGFALLRSNVKSGAESDVATSVGYGKRLSIHPYPEAGEASPTRFVDAAGQLFDSRIPNDRTFFESLNRVVQAEPWLERDKTMIQAH